MFVVFDLDGTIADIRHRVHFVRGARRPDWDAFFAACSDDMPVTHVIETFKAHLDAGHKVRIWSARSDAVRTETEQWLSDMGIDPCYLQHMRADGDNTPDVELKRFWLSQESDAVRTETEQWLSDMGIDPCYLQHMRADGDNTPDVELKRFWLSQEAERPDLIYDDRQRVVEMWRAEGIPCFQVVADWEGDGRKIEPVSDTLLTVMVGPSGAGKSTWVKENIPAWQVVSSDVLRFEYTGGIENQTRNDDVFTALHRIAKARLDSGLKVCIDATNLRRRDRLACASLAPAGTRVRYVVIDRPLAVKMCDGGWRNDVTIGEKTLVEVHHERFQSASRDIMAGDGLRHVDVIDLRAGATRAAA